MSKFMKQESAYGRLTMQAMVVALALLAQPMAYAQNNQVSPNAQQGSKLDAAQLSALVAPIALYPDTLVNQVLRASTHPSEVVEAVEWQRMNSGVHGAALNQALQQEPWDNSVKSLVGFPAVLQMLGSQMSWTTTLGEAVQAQPAAVSKAIQGLRAQAAQSGDAASTPQVNGNQGGQPVVVQQQPVNPQVVYVPQPQVVYADAYPPVVVVAPPVVQPAFSFGIGFGGGWRGGWRGGGWGGGPSWRGGWRY